MKHVKVKAKSKETYVPKARYVNSLTIYFSSKDSIFVTDGKIVIVLERWFDIKRGFYAGSWKPLVEVLSKKKSLTTVYEVWELARYYGVASHQTFRFPEIKPGTIKVKEKE